MKTITQTLIKTLLEDDITNSNFRIRGLKSELNKFQDYALINPDADFTQEINECEYSLEYWEEILKRSEDALEDFEGSSYAFES